MKFSVPSISLYPAIDRFANLEGAVYVFGKICLFAAVGFATFFGDTLRAIKESGSKELPNIKDEQVLEENDKQKPLDAFSIIKQRNIFGALAAVDPNLNSTAKQPEVELRLVATNVSSDGSSLAIIEDKKKSEQDVFEIGETVFNYAKVKKITELEVRLDHNGVEEVLVLEEAVGGSEGASGGVTSLNNEQTEFQVDSNELDDALANLPRLLSQARAVPYFRNGQSIGVRLFAIRAGSLYEKIGLKNGDILTAVNDNSLSDPTQALKLFEQLKSERSIQVAVERNGSIINLRYSIN